MNLEITLFGKKLKTPLILGSGTLGENKENLIKALKYGAGAVVTRTLRIKREKRKIFNPAYYIENGIYMLNADNQNLTSWEYWIDKAKEIEKYGRLIVSLSARDLEGCGEIISTFEKNFPPSFYEINFSCPHSAKLYGEISYQTVEKVLKLARKKTSQPLFLKLSLQNIDLKKLKEFEKRHLVDALVISNSIGPGLRINIETGKPYLESIVGGMSGRAIKPLVLVAIYEVKKVLKIPIIGVGGIESAEDVLEYIMLGCEAVQIYTKAHLSGLEIFSEIKNNLIKKLKDKKIEEIKGIFWKNI